jgi:spermidine synthase
MDSSLKFHDDGSIALFINGDLQFDSKDERIYHESLVIPALLVATKRNLKTLKALVIGGGDGLVARELFKSSCVSSVELVDYSQEVIHLAQKDIAVLNNLSLSDSRLSLHVRDAWEYVDEALGQGKKYDLIISDLTVPEDVVGAKFHSVDWYSKLNSLLTPGGVIAINAVSAQKTPQAFWSIFNGIVRAGLQPRPYHVEIPSFAAQGFGQDWGFLLAAKTAINAEDFETKIPEIFSGQIITDSVDVKNLFEFPSALFDFQSKAIPAADGSSILLHYFQYGVELKPVSASMQSSLSMDTQNLKMPDIDTGKNILPPDISEALSKSLNLIDGDSQCDPKEIRLVLHEAFELMSSVQKEQVADMINDFLEAPFAFLQAIDLEALISRLLKRASELPAHMVAELINVKEHFAEWSSDEDFSLNFGRRVLTILSAAIVIGNLLYPDMAYAKGGYHGGRGGGYHNNGWSGTTYYNYNNRYKRNLNKGPIGPGPSQAAEKQMLRNSLPQRNDVSDAGYIDEAGYVYPFRRYRMAQPGNSVKELSSAFRLGPQVDLLNDGSIAVPLTERSYFRVTPDYTHVIEQSNGTVAMRLHSEPDVLVTTKTEIERQCTEVQNGVIDGAISRRFREAISSLERAKELFGAHDIAKVSTSVPKVKDAALLFPGVWLVPGGNFVAIKREDTSIVYLDREKLYSDLGLTEIDETYPTTFKSVLVSYLSKMSRDLTANADMVKADRNEMETYKNTLATELNEYANSSQAEVSFGSRKVALADAIRLTKLKLNKTEQQIKSLDAQINQNPGDADLVKLTLLKLTEKSRA